MNLLPDDFWDDFENEGGWPQFAVAALTLSFLVAVVFLLILLLAPYGAVPGDGA